MDGCSHTKPPPLIPVSLLNADVIDCTTAYKMEQKKGKKLFKAGGLRPPLSSLMYDRQMLQCPVDQVSLCQDVQTRHHKGIKEGPKPLTSQTLIC